MRLTSICVTACVCIACAPGETPDKWSEIDERWRDSAFIAALGGPGEPNFDKVFGQIMEEGGWTNAASAASARADTYEPWLVLASGLNGEWKRQMPKQPWFKEALASAINSSGGRTVAHASDVFVADEAFYVDIGALTAVLANEDLFTIYYELPELPELPKDQAAVSDKLISDVNKGYETLKEKSRVLKRYCTYAEMVVGRLHELAIERRMDIVIVSEPAVTLEMHKYLEGQFSHTVGPARHMLALHVELELVLAQRTMSEQLEREMRNGFAAVEAGLDAPDEQWRFTSAAGKAGDLDVDALEEMQEGARAAWFSLLDDGAFAHWHKAAFVVHASKGRMMVSAAADPRQPTEGAPQSFLLEGCGASCEAAAAVAEQPECSASHRRRRQLQPSASSTLSSTERTWLAEWRERVACWYLGLPLPAQRELGGCMGALALHIGSRLDASLHAIRALPSRSNAFLNAPASTSSARAVGAATECEWVADEAQLKLPAAPAFPAQLDTFRLPPIPRLLPSWQRLQSLTRTDSHSVGGSTFGGSTFGGSTFGGSTFGADRQEALLRKASRRSFGTSIGVGAAFGGSLAFVFVGIVAMRASPRRSPRGDDSRAQP